MTESMNFPIELYLKPIPELELRLAELAEATRKGYPFDRRIIDQIKQVIKLKRSGKPVPLEVFQQ